MSDAGDPQDLAEALDADKFDEDRIDSDGPDLEPDYPRDRALGVDDDTATPRMEQVRESLEDRVGREEPDPAPEVIEATVDLTDGTGDPVGPSEGVAPAQGGAEDDRGDPVGRLVDRDAEDVVDADVDDEATAVASEVEGDPGSADLSAEEAALHVAGPPPMGRPDGGYVTEP